MSMIYKYPLESYGASSVKLPAHAKVLHCGAQGGVITLWAEVNTDAPERTRMVEVLATGDEVHTDWPHIGTVQPTEWLVFHVYLEPEQD